MLERLAHENLYNQQEYFLAITLNRLVTNLWRSFLFVNFNFFFSDCFVFANLEKFKIVTRTADRFFETRNANRKST